jgi:multidrug efflux system outer membrane protein
LRTIFRFDKTAIRLLNEPGLNTKPTDPGPAIGRGGLLAVVIPALFLGGCTFWNGPTFDPAATMGELPSRWTAGGGVPEQAVTGWIDDFGSPTLRRLVEEAVGANYSLAAARSRIYQARERARIAGADRLPAVDSSLASSRSQNLRGSEFANTRANNFNFNLDLAWEIDLWGRLKNLRDAQLARVESESGLYEASRLSLAANVVKTALSIVEAQGQIEISRRTLGSLRTNLKILDSRMEAGDLAEKAALEISLSRADIARAERAIVLSQRRLDGARRTLEALLGRYPEGTIGSIGGLPRISREIPKGIPSELLLRRPDLLAAEARVDAALKELSASRKALLPSLRITGSIGTATTDEFGDIFDIQKLVWGVGQNLARPLYQGGRLRANIRLDEAERDDLVNQYAETALTAFREVETAIAAEHYLKSEVAALSRAVEESRRAEQLSLDEFEQGLVEIITLLESQRRAFEAESVLLAARFELLSNRVDLYLALGGDFDHLPPPMEPLPEAAAVKRE